ncbi:hypothetical protein [Nocardia sp. NPDC003963]
MYANFEAVDDLVSATRAMVEQMRADESERSALVNLVSEVFTGSAGTANYEFQQRFSARLNNYNDALNNVDKAISGAVGVGGTWDSADRAAAARFMEEEKYR